MIVLVLALAIGYTAGYFNHLVRLPPGFLSARRARVNSMEQELKYHNPLTAQIEKARQLKAGANCRMRRNF